MFQYLLGTVSICTVNELIHDLECEFQYLLGTVSMAIDNISFNCCSFNTS